MENPNSPLDKKTLDEVVQKVSEMKAEIHKGVVGQETVIDDVIKCLICSANCLLEGVPGVAKTFLVKCLSQTIDGATFSRVQFTPDLLPSDITGVEMYEKNKGFSVMKGPVFANLVVADEINRAPPKVQAAMLQCMAERQVTIGKETFNLPRPFFVLATENPLEQQGVYPLPEAQLDRFLFKIYVDYPTREDEKTIMLSNSDVLDLNEFKIKKVLALSDLVRYQGMLHKVYNSDEVKSYIYSIIDATRHPDKYSIKSGKYVKWGGSPRATISLALAAKSNALINGRDYSTPDDVRNVSKNVLRHRIVLNYEGKAKSISTEEIIEDILDAIEVI